MPTEEEARWAQMAGQSGGGGTSTYAPPPPPPSATPSAQPPSLEATGKKRGKKEKAAKAPKPPKAERAPKRSARPTGDDGDWVLTLDEGPSRQELEQMAAAELFAALAPSYDLLHSEVPDAASPEDAQRRIESQLGPAPHDMDAAIPDHPIWKGDALVYQQLKRHYGKPHQGSSFARSWFPGGQR